MSRARHHTKKHGEKHRAEGGHVSESGNPNVLKLAKGESPAAVHGNESRLHLGAARGGKIKAHKRLAHDAKGHESGVHHRGRK